MLKNYRLRSSTSPTPAVAILVPFSLDQGVPAEPPAYLSAPSTAGPLIVLSTVYARYTPSGVEALRWALEKGFTIDIDIETNLRAGEGAWEDLEEFLTKAIPTAFTGKIILCAFSSSHHTRCTGRISDLCSLCTANILPPPDDLSLPIVKLLTHPSYNDYQSQTAALSLYANVFIKFTPPVWGSPTPAAPEGEPTSDTFDKKEWKKRIKMYSKLDTLLIRGIVTDHNRLVVGPALEAFGYERILFGSSPSPSSRAKSSAGDWYELARESFAELGTEQEDIDLVFFGNAKRVYSP